MSKKKNLTKPKDNILMNILVILCVYLQTYFDSF